MMKETDQAYNAATYINLRNELLGPVAVERVGNLPQWARSVIEDLIHRIYNLRQMTAGAAPGSWQDISTAPKDGTLVLMAWADGKIQIEPAEDNAGKVWYESAPTYWQPLPAPPQLAPPEESKE